MNGRRTTLALVGGGAGLGLAPEAPSRGNG